MSRISKTGIEGLGPIFLLCFTSRCENEPSHATGTIFPETGVSFQSYFTINEIWETFYLELIF